MSISIHWFRRDLRLHDNAALYHALKAETPVLPLFIFDKDILDKLEDEDDMRVTFIHQQIKQLHEQLGELGSSMLIRYGKPQEVWQQLIEEFDVKAVYTNMDYEPYAKERDKQVAELLSAAGVPFHTFKDHVILHKDEVLKDDGDPYVVFTPYKRKWLEKLHSQMDETEDGKPISFYFKPYPNEDYVANFHQTKALPTISLEEMGFKQSDAKFPPKQVAQKRIKNYTDTRNFPAQKGTSRLSVHYRFGTISIRQKAAKAEELNETYLSELIWRDFYAMILDHFPHVVDNPFRKKYGGMPWRNNEEEFEKWCEGKTGYPMVDAGMRELNETGFMHNRVRMITASFLTKHLLIDWRWGEAYFARKLLDFELASNNGGWQWAAGCGTDAAPYFRIFNPTSQQKKFDPKEAYIKDWIPEYDTADYPSPIVDHKAARERCLAVYKAHLDQQ